MRTGEKKSLLGFTRADPACKQLVTLSVGCLPTDFTETSCLPTSSKEESRRGLSSGCLPSFVFQGSRVSPRKLIPCASGLHLPGKPDGMMGHLSLEVVGAAQGPPVAEPSCFPEPIMVEAGMVLAT